MFNMFNRTLAYRYSHGTYPVPVISTDDGPFPRTWAIVGCVESGIFETYKHTLYGQVCEKAFAITESRLGYEEALAKTNIRMAD